MSKKILIVDDSKVQLIMMTKILEEVFSSYEVKSFSLPSEALKEIKAAKDIFHFALIDYNMEGMTGVELVKELFSLDFKPIHENNTSLLSANIQEAVQKKAADLKIDFIAKPFDKEKIMSFLQRKGIAYE